MDDDDEQPRRNRLDDRACDGQCECRCRGQGWEISLNEGRRGNMDSASQSVSHLHAFKLEEWELWMAMD